MFPPLEAMQSDSFATIPTSSWNLFPQIPQKKNQKIKKLKRNLWRQKHTLPNNISSSTYRAMKDMNAMGETWRSGAIQ